MNVEATAVVVALVEAIKNLVPAKVTGLTTAVVALIIGAVLGYLHLFGVVDVATGVALGAAAIGVHTVASAAGGK